MQQHRWCLTGVAATLLLAGCGGTTTVRDGFGVVERVVDGDTVDIRIDGTEERVRLIGIDTPETQRLDSPGECYGPEASTYTEALLPAGTQVRLERDTVGRDHYGRLLGYVHRLDDDLFVNYDILRQGYAQPLTIDPNTIHSATFATAARLAEDDNLGLWAACAG